MPPSRRRRRSFQSILNNHASIPSAPPILPSYPEPSRRRRRLTSCLATTVRLILPLRQWCSPQPSAFGHTLSLLCSRWASSPYYYFLCITLLLTLTHPPRFPVYKLRLGAPYWPPQHVNQLQDGHSSRSPIRRSSGGFVLILSS